MDKNSYIGVFDSGIGGLTVVKEIVDSLPNENIVYFGDTAHVPYGSRSKRQITQYVMDDVRFLRRYSVKAIVIACNTADSVAYDAVVETHPDLPIFGCVYPASRIAVRRTMNHRIGVIATKATVGSQAYNRAIAGYDPEAQVFSMPCPLLVPLVENGRFQVGDPVTSIVIREYLDPLVQKGIDTLILGCTHYPLLMDIIHDMYPDLILVSSSGAAAAALKETLQRDQMLSDTPGGEHRFFVNDDAAGVEDIAQLFMGRALSSSIEQVSIE